MARANRDFLKQNHTKKTTRPKIQGGSAHCKPRQVVAMSFFYWLLQQNSAKSETRRKPSLAKVYSAVQNSNIQR